MKRIALRRLTAVLTLAFTLGLLAPAWAGGKAPLPAPAALSAPPAAAHPAALVQALWSWLRALLPGVAPAAHGGAPVGISAGPCDDPNGECR